MIAKCFVCGRDINIDAADDFIKTLSGHYMCGEHYIRVNKMTLSPEVVEKVLEEKFGGTAIIVGKDDLEITISYL